MGSFTVRSPPIGHTFEICELVQLEYIYIYLFVYLFILLYNSRYMNNIMGLAEKKWERDFQYFETLRKFNNS